VQARAHPIASIRNSVSRSLTASTPTVRVLRERLDAQEAEPTPPALGDHSTLP
jgi:hypothetical protein